MHRLYLSIIVVLLLVITYLLVAREPGDSRIEAVGTEEISIAVLPFIGFGNENSDSNRLAEELTDLVVEELAKVPRVRVAGRGFVETAKKEHRTLKRIGQSVGVGQVMEGAVRRDGENLRVWAQLIDVDTDEHLWAHTYEFMASEPDMSYVAQLILDDLNLPQ